MYEYKMVQIPPNIKVSDSTGNEGAVYLENCVNKYALQDWEFHRIDSIGVLVQPGCISSMLGKTPEGTLYYIITFRKQK